MKENKGNELDELVQQASKALYESQTVLNDLIANSEFTDASNELNEDTIQLVQLVLQYRLDSQTALARLFQVNKLLFQILGIEPQSSFNVNLERMAYALGSNDLHHVLYSLSQLVNSLSLIANRYKKTLGKEYQQKQNAQSQQKHPKLYGKLQKAITFQKHFTYLIEKMSDSLHELKKGDIIGPILDHIAALRGPISQFFQAEQNGLELSYNLYQQINVSPHLTHTISTVLEQANLVLKELPPSPQHYHLFTPAKVQTSEKLEQRASMKRLGNYFAF